MIPRDSLCMPTAAVPRYVALFYSWRRQAAGTRDMRRVNMITRRRHIRPAFIVCARTLMPEAFITLLSSDGYMSSAPLLRSPSRRTRQWQTRALSLRADGGSSRRKEGGIVEYSHVLFWQKRRCMPARCRVGAHTVLLIEEMIRVGVDACLFCYAATLCYAI